MIYVWISSFVLLVCFFWALNVFGLPGNWLIVILTALWAWLSFGGDRFQIGWAIVVVLALIAAVGELVEFGASMVGTKRLGGSRNAAIFSVVGSIVGGILGAVVGLPIPIVGWIVGSVLFACVGALVGATLAERWQGKTFDRSLQIGGAAFVGRMLGTIGKIAVGSAIVVISISSLFF